MCLKLCHELTQNLDSIDGFWIVVSPFDRTDGKAIHCKLLDSPTDLAVLTQNKTFGYSIATSRSEVISFEHWLNLNHLVTRVFQFGTV